MNRTLIRARHCISLSRHIFNASSFNNFRHIRPKSELGNACCILSSLAPRVRTLAVPAPLPTLLHSCTPSQTILGCHKSPIKIPISNGSHRTTQRRDDTSDSSNTNKQQPEAKENIYTIPNYLTVGRFFMSPFLGYMVLQEQFLIACGLFIVTGLTDMLDGYIARNWKGQSSILGSVIDPLADKFMITILAITLTAVNLIPVWLTALILSRDVYLVFSGFRVRWMTLPPPKTFKRYFDFSHPTASVQPSAISKVNTNVQLLLLTATCAAPVFGYIDHLLLQALWGITAVTTSWSFLDYVTKAPYTVLRKSKRKS